MRLLHALIASALLGLFPVTATAQGDLVWTEQAFPLPDAPAGFRSETRDSVRWDYPPQAAGLVEDLRSIRAEAWSRIEEDLGVDIDDAITVRIARNPAEMRALAPRGLGVPPYAVGVAYPHLGVVILGLEAPTSWQPPNVEEVFVHELSHVALRRAVGGADMPRWFVEGMAVHHADERSLERFEVLWRAYLRDGLIDLPLLDDHFPERIHEVSLAYAEAADVVTFLRRTERGRTKMHRLIAELAKGEPFEEAMLEAYALSPQQLEREWTAGLEGKLSNVPMLVGGGTFWVLAALLLVLAWRRRRREHRERLAELATLEQERDEAFDRLERIIDEKLAEDEGPRFLVSGDPPQGRDPGVPTVEFDGRNHTLH